MLQSTLASQSHWLVRELYMRPVWHVFLCEVPPAHVKYTEHVSGSGKCPLSAGHTKLLPKMTRRRVRECKHVTCLNMAEIYALCDFYQQSKSWTDDKINLKSFLFAWRDFCLNIVHSLKVLLTNWWCLWSQPHLLELEVKFFQAHVAHIKHQFN